MNKNISQIVERLKLEFGYKRDKDIADALEMSGTAFYNHKARGTIPYEALSTFCEKKGISFDWLLTGDAPVRRAEKEKPLQGAEEPAIYKVRENPKLAEVIRMLKEHPQDTELVLKLLKGKKDIKEALEGFEISKIKEQEG